MYKHIYNLPCRSARRSTPMANATPTAGFSARHNAHKGVTHTYI